MCWRLEDDVQEAVKQFAQRDHSQDRRRHGRERDYGQLQQRILGKWHGLHALDDFKAVAQIDYVKFFSRSHHAAFSKKTGSTRGCFKNIWRFRRSPCRLLRLPKRIGLKSYFRLSALVVRLFSITSSDASTHFRPASKTG